ncbi:guanylate kinase [Candidatus Peregrinibacteria bacterium]|jgi:guanylate kinase|nr:guanylate kinase [Candidatus Peregrinibacteria bacterium]MBT7736139.1 guanylate kinase [Candidatus Peregrinibacteria bacterium]
MYTGKLFLIVGPSGSGKGTVISRLKDHYPGFVYPVSYTTRAPRDGEEEGVVYHYVSKDEFKRMIDEDELLEYAIVHSNNYYGTSKKDILDPLKGGAVVVREVDIQGFNSIKEIVPEENLVSIFMKVPDLEDLKGRILRRGEMTDDELQRRMDSALKEMAQADECEYQVQNKWGEVDQSVKAVDDIVQKEIEGLY